jgi:dephospho-CoA kinase
MITIGITGGIGSGKSTFCRYLQRDGTEIVVADSLAKSLMQENMGLRQNIIGVFGEMAYYKDGTLNREFLSHQAFSLKKVQLLNNMVHPIVKNEVLHLISKAEKRGVKNFIYEAALLLKDGRPDFLDYIVWVDSHLDNRVQRVAERDSVVPESVMNRIEQQQSFESVQEFVDIVILNDGSLEELKKKADNLYKQINTKISE